MSNAEQLILETLKEKASLKLSIHKLTEEVFQEFKTVLKEIKDHLKEEAHKIDDRLQIEYHENSPFSIQIRVAGDVLVFEMHSNVFFFDSSHDIWNLSYVRDDQSRAFCGLINVYNFLADSIQFRRSNDVGYLVGRVFINKDRHFMMEGKRQMGFLYNNFSTEELNPRSIKEVIYSAVLYCLNFDLLTPPYETVQETTFSQITENAQTIKAITGKRLGFRFHKDEDQIT
ncbi:MAG: hypothetical protein WED33_12365 [Bacteroidia bacterium]